MARLTTIRLYGVLGARFGRVHRLAVQTSAEAVKALCINLDGLESYLMNAKKNGITFAVFRGKRNIGVDDFKELSGESDIRIAPVMEGAKKAGMFQTILGAVMVVAGVVIGAMTSWTGVGLTFGAGLVMSGASMMAGGIYQMLSPQPKGLQGRDDPDNKPSYAFGSSVNTLAMGKQFKFKQTQLTAIGCTRESEAQRRGGWAVYSNSLDRIITVQTGLDGFAYVPGTVFAFADERLSGRVYGGRITDYDAGLKSVTTDRGTSAVAGDTLMIRTQGGTG